MTQASHAKPAARSWSAVLLFIAASPSFLGEAIAQQSTPGAQPACTMAVVSCNYGHLYSGTFAWQIELQSPIGSDVTSVQMSVIKGKATCLGSVESKSKGVDPLREPVQGPGLFAVEFVADPGHPPEYKISVACPTTSSGQTNAASLGNGISIESPLMPAKVVGENLSGTQRYPAPEVDPDNGVTGTVQISWKLDR